METNRRTLAIRWAVIAMLAILVIAVIALWVVLKTGAAVVARGYGRADLARDIEAGPATAYRLASVSKQFTAAAILLLAQDGKLSIEDPVRKWLPSLPHAAAAIPTAATRAAGRHLRW